MIRYIEERDRENLANIVSGLYAVCNLVGSGTGSGDRCLNILQLSNYETNTESGASNSEVESAAKDVIDGGPFSMFRSERIDLLRKAADWGISFSVGDDLEKKSFLAEVLHGRDRDFLKDILNRILFMDSGSRCNVHGGMVLCSKEYIDYYEKQIFGMDIPDFYSHSWGNFMYGQLITDSLRTVAKTIMQDLSDGNPEESYISPGNYDRMMDLYEDLSHFSEVSSELILFRGKLEKYYSIFREIKRVQEQAASLNIGSYEEWTNIKSAEFWLDSNIKQITDKSIGKIEVYKEKYVKALAEAIQSVSSMNDIPTIVLAGVAYTEYGGDPPFFDNGKRFLSSILPDWMDQYSFMLAGQRIGTGPTDRISYGNLSMQLRRAAESLDFYGKLDGYLEQQMIFLLQDDRTALVLCGTHLHNLKEIDFPDKRADQMTLEAMKTLIGRYNQGPDVSEEKARSSSYAITFESMYAKLQSWVGD